MDEIRKLKRNNYIALGIVVALVLACVIGAWVFRERQRFTTEKWQTDPENRTRIVDDLLTEHALVGMTEAEVVDLLGDHNNDYGYFDQDDRYVYWMGPERGLFSIDSEWLILDFSDGVVVDCFLTRD